MRSAEIARRTKETDISLSLSLEGGDVRVDTGIGFFDHMLNSLFFHGGMGAALKASGDLNVDAHHTVEDVGIVIGQALREALGDKKGIARFAHAYAPMDEALAFAALDISGRPYLAYDAPMPQEFIGQYDTCLTVEFMRALAASGGLTLHMKAVCGENSHHMTEALFKALALALKAAVRITGNEAASTKGKLD
jgi:imidazoleglycerol-phosphate dehydratase